MSAKETIKRIVDSFNSKPYLKDKTREMGEGLMLGASLADESNERSKAAEDTTKRTEEKYKEQILAQDLNPNKDPELVDLRNGNATAGERITKFEQETTAQFQQTKTEVTAQLAQTALKSEIKPIHVSIRPFDLSEYKINDLVFIFKNILNWESSNWEVGSLSSATGLPVVGENRIRTKEYIEVLPNKKYKIFTKTPLFSLGSIIIIQYKQDNSFLSTTGWQTDEHEITMLPETSKIKIVLQNERGDSSINVDSPSILSQPVITQIY